MAGTPSKSDFCLSIGSSILSMCIKYLIVVQNFEKAYVGERVTSKESKLTVRTK